MKDVLFIKRIFLSCMILGSGLLSVIASDEPVSLIIADVQDLTSRSTESIGIRDRVVSILMDGYECHVLSRSSGFALAQESAISTISKVNKSYPGKDEIAAADYGVEVEYEKTDAAYVRIRPVDLRLSSVSSTLPVTKFKVPVDEPVEAIIAQKIAERLSLPKRSIAEKGGVNSLPTNLTWCVFPFSRFDQISADGEILPPGDPDQLAIRVEVALQSDDNKFRLVDHKQMDDLLRERLVHAMFNADSIAGTLGRMVGADRILTGFVSKKNTGKLRIDLHIVDVKSSAVLCSGWEECASIAELPTMAIRLAKFLVIRSGSVPKLGITSQSQRRKEAEFLLSTDLRGNINSASSQSRKTHNAEAAYLLANDDPAFCVRIVEYLYEEIVKCSDITRASYKRFILNKNCFYTWVVFPKRAVSLIDSIVKQIEGREPKLAPFLVVAKAHYMILDFPGAIDLLEKHINACPNIERRSADLLLVRCYFESGKSDKAGVELEKAIRKHGEDHETQQLALEIKAVSADDNAKYKSLVSKANTDSYQFLPDEWDQWLKLGRKFEEPAKYIEILHQWLLPGTRRIAFAPPIAGLQKAMLAQAECHAELGNREAAMQKCKAIIASLEYRAADKESKSCLEKAKKLLEELEAKSGKVEFCFKKAKAARVFPEKYCISIVPVEGTDTNTLNSVVDNLRDFFAGRIIVLPSVPVPNETAKAERHAFVAEDFMQKVIGATAFPADSMLAVILTKETLEERAKNYSIEVSGKAPGNPMLFSCRRYGSLMQRKGQNVQYYGDPLNLLEWRIAYAFHSFYSTNRCSFPCLFSNFAKSIGEIPFICPACQEEYKKADFDKIHNDLMEYLKKAGAKIVRAEK